MRRPCSQFGVSRRTWPAHVEGIVPQLFDDQQGSRARDESTEGIVSGLGHSLCRDASLRTALPFGMVEQDQGSRRAPAGRTLLPTTRRPAAGAPTSSARAVGRSQEAPCDEIATPDSWYWSASGGSLGGVDADASSVSHQAATVELQRAGVGDPRQRAVPRRGGTATTFEETRHPARSQ